jgi:hypothetical protein
VQKPELLSVCVTQGQGWGHPAPLVLDSLHVGQN